MAGLDVPATETDRAEDDGGPGDDGPEEISNDELFDVLSNRRRRFTLHYLKQHEDEAVEMGDRSTRVAAWETDTPPEELAYDERKRVHTSLYQYHAPKLDEAGIVEYDSQRGVVELTEAGADLDLYLEAVAGREIPWATYHLLLGGFGVSLMSAVTLGIPPTGMVPEGTWGLFVAVAFLVSSAVFVYDNRVSMRLGSEGQPPEIDED
jgi:DNA-binding transcriptional ArsR family regulator